MPRRNHRHDQQFEPLDLTADMVNRDARHNRRGRRPDETFRQFIDRTQQDERLRAQQQRNARVNKGIDWSICLVPGCGEALVLWDRPQHSDPSWRDHTVALPLCLEHLAVAGSQAAMANDPLLVEATALVLERETAKQAEEKAEGDRAWRANTYGEIYYIRQNDLIKVGWSRDLPERLRSYGPNVQVLCHYPASYADETNLHRHSRPFLAKGREWYRDCPALRDFVQQVINKHGPPTAAAYWTKPSMPSARPRRRAG